MVGLSGRSLGNVSVCAASGKCCLIVFQVFVACWCSIMFNGVK